MLPPRVSVPVVPVTLAVEPLAPPPSVRAPMVSVRELKSSVPPEMLTAFEGKALLMLSVILPVSAPRQRLTVGNVAVGTPRQVLIACVTVDDAVLLAVEVQPSIVCARGHLPSWDFFRLAAVTDNYILPWHAVVLSL